MIKLFVLIISMSNAYQGSAIDHIEFQSLDECKAAGEAFVKENKSYDNSRYVCVTKSIN